MSPAQRGLCLLYHLLASTSEQIAQNELRAISSKKKQNKNKNKKTRKKQEKNYKAFYYLLEAFVFQLRI